MLQKYSYSMDKQLQSSSYLLMIINKTFQSFKVNYYSIFTTKLMGNFNRYNHEFKHVNILSTVNPENFNGNKFSRFTESMKI